MADAHPHTQVTAVMAELAWETRITAGRHDLVVDELPDLGGRDTGPGPFHYVLAGLAACTSITLRMYAQRKGATLKALTVEATMRGSPEGPYVDRVLTIDGDLDEAVRTRMAEIAEKTPVTLALKGGMDIRTRLAATA